MGVLAFPFIVHTDHKPLEPLFQGTASKPSLQLQEYSYTVEYQPGATNPAGYLPQHPRAATLEDVNEALETEEYVRYVLESTQPLPLSLEVIREVTQAGDCL